MIDWPLVITLAGPPRGKGRARATKTGQVYTPAETRKYEDQLRHVAYREMRGETPVDGPLYMKIEVAVQMPKLSKKKTAMALAEELRPTTRPDLDNYAKIAADGLNGIVYRDDKQIVDLFVTKKYAMAPRLTITVTPLVVASQE